MQNAGTREIISLSWLQPGLLFHSILLLIGGLLSLQTGTLGPFGLFAAISFLTGGIFSIKKIPVSILRTKANGVSLFRLAAIYLFLLHFDNILVYFLIGVLICCLDGLDGYLARRYKESSAFGAYLDAETDAFLVAVFSLFLYQNQLADWWVLIAGFMRYLYFVPTYFIQDSNKEVYRFFLAKVIAVIFMVSLLAAFVLPLPISRILLLLSTIGLVYSFSLSFYHDIIR